MRHNVRDQIPTVARRLEGMAGGGAESATGSIAGRVGRGRKRRGFDKWMIVFKN